MIDKMVTAPRNFCIEFNDNNWVIKQDTFGVHGLTYEQALNFILIKKEVDKNVSTSA